MIVWDIQRSPNQLVHTLKTRDKETAEAETLQRLNNSYKHFNGLTVMGGPFALGYHTEQGSVDSFCKGHTVNIFYSEGCMFCHNY